MKNIFLIFSILIGLHNSYAQSDIKNYNLGIRAARSFATSGDYYGGFGNVFLEKVTKKNGSISMVLGANMHTSEDFLFYPNPMDPNDIIDGSWRYLSAGVQLGLLAGKKLALAEKHSFHFQMGPLVRYQNMSTDGFNYYILRQPNYRFRCT